MKNYSFIIVFIFVLIITQSCQQAEDAHEAFEQYIDLRFDLNASKDDYIKLTTGPLKEDIQSLTKEDFESFKKAVGSVSKRSYSIVYETCEPTKCLFTYVMRLKFEEADKETFRADIKKVAVIEKVETHWKVSDVISEPKSYFKGLDPITPEDFEKKHGFDPDKIMIDEKGQMLRDSEGNPRKTR